MSNHYIKAFSLILWAKSGEYRLNLDDNSRQEYVYLNSTPIVTMSAKENYRVYADHLDTSRRVATDDKKAEILWKWESKPFGESKATGTLSFNLRFPGQYYDNETGTHYNINRDYNPVTGRYIQSDPIGFDGWVNGFGYALNNILLNTDLAGLVSLNLFDPSTDIYESASWTWTGSGYTVGGHGNPTVMADDRIGRTLLKPKDLLKIMKKNGYSGGTISLFSCQTGKGSNSFAQKLATASKSTVYAPTTYYCYTHSRWRSNYTSDSSCKKDNVGLTKFSPK